MTRASRDRVGTPLTAQPGNSVEYLAGQAYPIASMARWILSTIVDTYATNDTATALPETQFTTIGTVAVDGPLLCVMYGGVTVGPPGVPLVRPYRWDSDPRSAACNGELWRPFPAVGRQGLPPSSEAVQKAAEITMQDSWLLLESAYKADQLGVGVIASVAVNSPQGEMVGINMTLELQVA